MYLLFIRLKIQNKGFQNMNQLEYNYLFTKMNLGRIKDFIRYVYIAFVIYCMFGGDGLKGLTR